MPASASGAVEIGETGTPDANCSANDNIVQAETGGPPSYAVPAGGGVITSWRSQGDSAFPPGRAKLIVWRRTSAPDQFTVVGKADLQTFTPGPAQTFATRIPVQSGDLLGLRTVDTFGCLRFAGLPGDVVRLNNTTTEPPDGSAQIFDFTFAERLLVAASVEPDCDADGLGDETQDPELTPSEACGKGNRSLTLDANKNKIKKGKKVTLRGRISGVAKQGPCESGQTIELQRKRPKQATFTIFANVQTDAQGNFSLKKKVKKTFEFRAQVLESAACTAALSNSEKVKVKRKPQRSAER